MKSKLNSVFFTLLAVMMLPGVAFAQDGAADHGYLGWIALGSGLAIGAAAFGGALGQGRAAAAALEGIARNPQASGRIFTPMIIGLALIESLVIYALLVAYLLQGYIGTVIAGH